MIQLQITGRHYELDSKIVAYTHKKLGGLDKYLPKNCRNGVHGKAVLEFDEAHIQSQQCICEVTIEVKGERLHAKEATINMYAAIDICEQKLKSQVLTYKSKHDPARNRRQRLWNKMRGISANPDEGADSIS